MPTSATIFYQMHEYVCHCLVLAIWLINSVYCCVCRSSITSTNQHCNCLPQNLAPAVNKFQSTPFNPCKQPFWLLPSNPNLPFLSKNNQHLWCLSHYYCTRLDQQPFYFPNRFTLGKSTESLFRFKQMMESNLIKTTLSNIFLKLCRQACTVLNSYVDDCMCHYRRKEIYQHQSTGTMLTICW